MCQVTRKESSQARWHIVNANVMITNEVSAWVRSTKPKMRENVAILNGEN